MQIEPPLDPPKAPLDLIHALVRNGVVAVQTGDLGFERRQAKLDGARIFGHLIDSCPNVPQVFQNKVLDMIGHRVPPIRF
ncbi:hypothetical protein [Thiocapsa sp.]|uniref:hypothetical protein n=1 Tax=Thiocapsa sp. TaxID=2024551 RepID=UPI002C2563D5|nr:hypothetical protein [Thiocapsa sp.]HSO82071.1 hypothetical protein [Thiocapsa sp.]